ncbi:MAG: hypothetical protein ACHBN1_27025 [Heteroscytonema crispum UTEX LB 1556]
MVGRQQQVDIKAANDRSLRSLGRAIAFSAGQFSLVVVCCNYQALQQRMLQQLQETALTPYQIGKLVLPENAVNLYTRIHALVEDEQPSALMVLGLESVEAIDDLLRAINHIRDEFRKRHPFPMVLWVNDDVVQKLVRLAPDLASWGATPIRFDMTTLELLVFLQQETNSLFAKVLNPHGDQKQGYEVADHYCTLGQVWEQSHELHYAIRDLQSRGISLEPELHASLEFVFGLDNYVGDRIEPALTHFRESLQFWQQLSAENKQEKTTKSKLQMHLKLS